MKRTVFCVECKPGLTLNSFLFLTFSVKVAENEDFMTTILEEMSHTQEQLFKEKKIITG